MSFLQTVRDKLASDFSTAAVFASLESVWIFC